MSAEREKEQLTVKLVKVTAENIKRMKNLNSLLFPVSYGENFYKRLVNLESEAYLSYWGEKCIGAVCFRKEKIVTDLYITKKEFKYQLYIMTLGVLSIYRHRGVGSILLKKVLQIGMGDPSVIGICLHVQVNNRTAIEFYKRFGFSISSVSPNYYLKLDPSDAYILYKDLCSHP
jgi:ribosomal protein S18 acetylase RimI-like enzyme